MIEPFVRDVREALRGLIATPVTSTMAVLTLAMGLGFNAALFTAVEAVLLRPLPFDEPAQLVDINTLAQPIRDRIGGGGVVSIQVYEGWKQRSRSFVGLAAYAANTFPVLTGAEGTRRIDAFPVSSDFFPLLGAQPALGRGFLPREDVDGALPVIVLSHSLWTTAFGADPGALGRSLQLDDTTYQVIGVMPAGFRFPSFPPPYGVQGPTIPEAWLALGPDTARLRAAARTQGEMYVLGRLLPGVQPTQAQEELDGLLGQLRREGLITRDLVANVTPLRVYLLGTAGQPLLLLIAGAGLVLLTACASVAHVLLARSMNRRRQTGIRLALGASRGRLVRRELGEATLLSLTGGIGAVMVAQWTAPILALLGQSNLPSVQSVGVNLPVVAATLFLALVTGCAVGLVPALEVARRGSSVQYFLGRSQASSREWRSLTADVLVVSQIALTVVLLMTAGLLSRSLVGLLRQDLGVDPDGVITARIRLPAWSYRDPQQRKLFAERLEERLKELPAPVKSAVATGLPLTGTIRTSVSVPGSSQESLPYAGITAVTPGYFEALGMSLRRGRLLEKGQSLSSAVIDEEAARTYFGSVDPLGRELIPQYLKVPVTVVGIVGSTSGQALREADPPQIYVLLSAAPVRSVVAVLRSPGGPAVGASMMREAIRQVDPQVPVDWVKPLKQTLLELAGRETFYAVLLITFALAAVGLSIVSVFGLTYHAVSRRLREMAIRMAVGARGRDVVMLYVGRGLRLTGIGLAVGLCGAFAAGGLVSNLLYGVTRTDPLTMGAVAVLILCTGGLASYLPARRASRLDPVRLLRIE